jgi:protein-export membrane protein SecD
MQKSNPMPILWWVKCFFILCALAFGLSYTIPTFVGPVGSLPTSKINLGLDLKGGLSLTLNVEIEKAVKDSISRAVSRAKEILVANGIQTGPFKVGDDLSLSLQVDDPSQATQIQKRVSEQTVLLLFDKQSGQNLIFQINRSLLADFKKQVMQQAINTIRNRIDQFGVSEPNIFQAGETRIMVELPGMTDMEHAKQLLGNTAQLDFRLVLNKLPQGALTPLLDEARKALKIDSNQVQPSVIEDLSQWLRDKNKIPQNSTIVLHKVANSAKETSIPYLVEAHGKLTGDLIEDAQAEETTENFTPQYAVALKFKPQGAKIFGDLTTEAFKPENKPNEIAIILDGNVQSSPVVNGPILGGNARITMGRGSTESQLKEAQDLALVLRAGALPADVKVVEERQIGPSEGAQNIRSGIISSLIAAALVVIVMLVIYGMAGFVANIAMLFNILLILAFMSMFGATLTLPGIAGIVLTMAIAVDGNVVINERIREEIRSGLSQKQAFYKGYSTSFRTLIDAHITSAVAGLVLVIYGNPTIKGFAVTLLTGIICTLFTSYYVTEVIGQWFIEKTNLKRFG